jgi:hypothetical protein
MSNPCSTCRCLSDNNAFCQMYELPRKEARDLCQGDYHQPREATHD